MAEQDCYSFSDAVWQFGFMSQSSGLLQYRQTCLMCTLQDGKLTTEELLRSLVLDGAVSEDAVDADVFAVFDK